MNIDFINKPKENLETLLEKYNPNKMYLVIEDVLSDPRGYALVLQQLIDIMKWGFEITEIRKRPIKFIFHPGEEEILSLQLNNFISNLIIWYGFMDIERPDLLDKNHIIDFSQPNTIEIIIKYIENEIFPYFEGDFHSKNKLCDEIFHNIRATSKAFSKLMGMSISIYDIWRASKITPEINDIMFGKIDPNLQPTEIEEELNRRTDRLVELFKQTDCDLKPLLMAGGGLSKGQLREMFVKIGLKSDIYGNTIPYLIDANLVVDGLVNPADQYIQAGSGRKALILQKRSMGEPGAFYQRLNTGSTSSGVLRDDQEICNSVNFISYYIKDNEWLRLLDKRYYIDSRGKYKLLDGMKDTHLIGKVVNFASPCTCNSKEGICRKCYGELYEINKDLFSVGSFGSTKACNPLGQRILKAKHYQGTESSKIHFPEEFNDVFDLNSTEIVVNSDSKIDEDLFIVFDEVIMEQDDDRDYYYVKNFKIINAGGENLYNISEDNGSNIYLSDTLTSYYKKLKNPHAPISLNKITDEDEDAVLFQVEISNKELTGPIKALKRILNKENTSSHTVSEITEMLVQEFINIDIKINFVHIEAILRAFIRKKSNILEYPDWSRNGDPDDARVVSINDGLKKNPSALVSLSYGYFKQQLTSPDLYEKTGASHLDALFVRNLSKYID